MRVSAPRALRQDDLLDGFDCGRPELNDWLVTRALKSDRDRVARTFVVCEPGERGVIGYYCLSAYAVVRSSAPGALSRNAPDPVPAVLLGRLAVDRRWQGMRLGSSLLHDAVANAGAAAQRIGLRAMVVDAIDDTAADFYVRHGFKPFPDLPLRLFHRL